MTFSGPLPFERDAAQLGPQGSFEALEFFRYLISAKHLSLQVSISPDLRQALMSRIWGAGIHAFNPQLIQTSHNYPLKIHTRTHTPLWRAEINAC